MKIAGVRFKDNWKIYDFDATSVEVSVGDAVIVESDQGPGFARVMRLRETEELPPSLQPRQEQGGNDKTARNGKNAVEEEIEVDVDDETTPATAFIAKVAPPPSSRGHRKIVRKANEEDLRKAEKNKVREAEAYRTCQEMISERELPMKLIRVEYSFDASRATFYFFSETRVDFRELVKDLAYKLKSRIEMRQVGVRDVARMIGGFGPCGRELCCTAFLKNFEPVSIRMAKKQDMVLNPAKISGVCGRLLCCLSYEFPMYDDIKKDLADMRETVNREKRAVEEQRITEERREQEERRAAEDKRRQEDDKRKLEQKQQRDKKRPPDQKDGRKPEKKKEEPKDQKPRQPDQRRDKPRQPQQQKPQQPKPEQQPRPQQPRPERQPKPEVQAGGPEEAVTEVQGEEGQAQGDKQGKRKRRFWRNRKKKKDGGGAGSPPAPSAPTSG